MNAKPKILFYDFYKSCNMIVVESHKIFFQIRQKNIFEVLSKYGKDMIIFSK